jgi:HlyD family secretion protein
LLRDSGEHWKRGTARPVSALRLVGALAARHAHIARFVVLEFIMRTRLLVVGLVLLAGVGAGAWYLRAGGGPPVAFKSEPVKNGPLIVGVSATGTLEPEEVIDVGSQVGGQIITFGTGTDGRPIDYDSPVGPDTVLARIDDTLYKAKAEQSRAQVRAASQQLLQAKAKAEQARAGVEQAKANTLRAGADLQQANAKASQAVKDWGRAKSLQTSGGISSAEYDAAMSANDANRAAVSVAEAALAQAKAAEANAVAVVADADAAVGTAEAAVATAKAVLAQDEANLGYCTIKSTVEGTIIDRRVTIGQTVQSSFNTPSLFLIAKDLRRMKVWVSVNEADIGRVRVGQTARFSVDAFPGETFSGTVSRIRLNATNTQNVVVYTVEVTVENPERRLLPYMTANLQFEVQSRPAALQVPNAALRYRPAPDSIAKGAGAPGRGAKEQPGKGTVWVQEGNKVRPVAVTLGLTDGTFTEITGGELPADAKVVVGESRGSTAPTEAGNPFATKIGGKAK